jgi:hypothetical protein
MAAVDILGMGSSVDLPDQQKPRDSVKQPSKRMSATRLSFTCVVLAIVLSKISNVMSAAGVSHSPTAALILFGLMTGLLVAGCGCGLIAVFQGCGSDTKNLAGPAVVGMSLNGLLLFIAVDNFSKGRQKSLANRTALQTVEARVDDIRSKARIALANTNEMNVEDAAGFFRSVNEAGQGASGDARAILKASAAMGSQLVAARKEFDLTKQIVLDEALKFSSWTNRNQYEQRRQMVEAFLKENDSFEKLFENQDRLLKSELLKQGIDERKATEILKAYERSSEKNIAVARKGFGVEREIGMTYLELIQVVESHWGEWEFDHKNREVTPLTDVFREDYGKAVSKLEELEDKERRLQQEALRTMLSQKTAR